MRYTLLIGLTLVLALPFALRRAKLDPPANETLVVITPHNGAIRHEFGQGFARWHFARTGRQVRIDWRVVGGTADIARYLESAYAGAFEREWERRERSPWSSALRSAIQDARLPADAPAELRRARELFLTSNVTSGIDVFFGGDAYQYGREATAGRLVDAGLRERHPEWFTEEVMPERFRGQVFRDSQGRWFGAALSSYGLVFNRISLARRSFVGEPQGWSDLGDARLAGEVGLADPTKSGVVCEAFESMIQQQMQLRWQEYTTAGRDDAEAAAVRDGWLDGLRLIQRAAANARYFTDSSQKPPIDVANGDCAIGLCIDFYGRQQQEAVRQRGDVNRVGYVTPPGGSAASADPIGVLRGAPHPELAIAFLEFVLSPEEQRLWALRPGTPGGPNVYALRRMPIRRDFYADDSLRPSRSDPEDNPYGEGSTFIYRPAWTGELFRDIGFITRALCMDSHRELVAAATAIATAPEEHRAAAMAVLRDLSAVTYDRVWRDIHPVLNARDRIREVRLAGELGAHFRQQYRRAEAIAAGR